MLRSNKLHMGHYGQQQSEVGHHCHLQFHTQPHTGMLIQPVSQQCKWSIVAALVDGGSLLHLLFDYENFQLPFQHTVVEFQ